MPGPEHEHIIANIMKKYGSDFIFFNIIHDVDKMKYDTPLSIFLIALL